MRPKRPFSQKVLFLSASSLWTFILVLFYFHIRQEVTVRSQELSGQISQQILHRLESKIRSLQVMSISLENDILRESLYFQQAEYIMSSDGGFLSINWVEPDGEIQWVYPLHFNRLAKGRNLLERADVRSYLERSRDKNMIQITPLVRTYQGLVTSVVYIPVYKNSVFKGWLNSVIQFSEIVNPVVKDLPIRDNGFVLKWKNDSTEFFKFGLLDSKIEAFDFESPFYNLTMQLTIYNSGGPYFGSMMTFLPIIYVAGLLLLFYLFKILGQSSDSKNELLNLNHLLISKNMLLSALSHDLASGVTILGGSLEMLKWQECTTPKTLSRIKRTVQGLTDLLVEVRRLHLQSIGFKTLSLEWVSLDQVVLDVLDSFMDLAQKKGIEFEVNLEKAQVKAHAVTLRNCVLWNVITNAIKFSPPDSKISIRSVVKGRFSGVEIGDHGVGINIRDLENLLQTLVPNSTPGTAAESGSGLGLFQVKYFMEAYGGIMEVDSQPDHVVGTRVRLLFVSNQR